MYIKRHIESVISECLQQFPVLLVTGPRKVDKTTLLQYVCKNFGYITFDDPLVLKEAIEETNLFLINNKPPLLIDEVHIGMSYDKMAISLCRKINLKENYLFIKYVIY